jgi:uncharacterized membrane protein
MSRVSIRYNHDSDNTNLKWRVLIDGKENLASDVEVLTASTTTKDTIEGVGEKYHITCDPSVVTWEGDKVILSDKIKSVSHKRHILKSLTYRIYSSCITSLIATVVTGNAALGISIGSADFFIKIITYYIHERIWYKIPFGIEKVKK